MLLLCSLRGTIIIYQGEELGLAQVEVPFERLQDPEAKANWPQTLSRDGARTPMPWSTEAPNLGFSPARPWLPLGEDHVALNVAKQAGEPTSMLNLTRSLVRLRAQHPALRGGAIEVRHADEHLLVFDRRERDERLRCVFNLSDATVESPRSAGVHVVAVGEVSDKSLGPWSARIEKLA
jgi:alpha-glucosidase